MLLVRKYSTILNYQSPELQYEAKIRIDYHCDRVLDNEIVINYTRTTKIAKAIGNFFGFFSHKVDKEAQEAEKTINDKVDRFSRESFSD